MAEAMQCDNCGAMLTEEDVFCGECGAPRTSMAGVSEPATGEPSADPGAAVLAEAAPRAPSTPGPGSPPPAQPSGSSEMRWRVAAIFLAGLGVIACLGGLLASVLFGAVGGEGLTAAENWLYAALCCLLPIGGTGAILAAIAAMIWYTRLRNR